MAVRVGQRPQWPAPGPQVIQKEEVRARCWGWLKSMAPSEGQLPLSSTQFFTFFLEKTHLFTGSLSILLWLTMESFHKQCVGKQNRATEQLRLARMNLQSSVPPRSCRKEAAWPRRRLSWAVSLVPSTSTGNRLCELLAELTERYAVT